MDDSSFSSMADEIAGLLGIDASKRVSRAFATNAVHGYSGGEDVFGAVSFPLYQTAAFAHPALHESTGFAYSRCGNPTVLELENTIALLEGGLKSIAFSSGLAALTSMLKLFSSGDRIIVGDDLYGGTYRLFNDVYSRQYGLVFDYVDLTDTEATEAALSHGAAAVFCETPTNPTMKIIDIAVLSKLAHAHDARLIVDNTLLTCYFQKPLELGADIVVYSGTKYLCGHNDCTCGFLVVKDESLIEPVFMGYLSEGAALAPFDAWLMLRSLKTLPLRLEKQQQNAGEICEFLKGCPAVSDVFYAGDSQHPHYELSSRQARGFGAMISFNVDSPQRAQEALRRVKIVSFAESLGGCETLITYPSVQTHGAIPEAIRERIGITECMLRLSVGIESADDIIMDLDQALR